MGIIHKNIIFLIFIVVLTLTSCEQEREHIDSYVIEKNGMYGLIDSTGNEIVAPRFLSIEPIQKDGVALAIIDTIYTTIRDSSSQGIRNLPVLNIKYGYITSTEKFLLPEPSYAKIRIENSLDSAQAYSKFCQEASFYGGLAIAQDTTTLLYGYIGLNGDTIIPAEYRKAYKFHEGRAAVQLDYKERLYRSDNWGLINPDGNKVCDFVFNQIETPVNKRAFATIIAEGKGPFEGETILTIFMTDENGKIIYENMDIGYIYSNFSKDGIAVAIPNRIGEYFGSGFRFVSEDGEFIEPLNVENITEEQAKMILDSKFFLGELLPKDIKFTNATRFSEGYAAVNLGTAWIFIDKQLIPRGSNENPIYEYALPFSNGLAGIKLNGKFGYINREFNIVIPCKYDSCAIAGKNLCRVYGGRKTGNDYSIISYIDRKGQVIWQNVNYQSKYWEEAKKNKHGWKDFEYSYIGKDYIPLYVILSIAFIIAVWLIVSRQHEKETESNKVKTDTNTVKFDTDEPKEIPDKSLSEQIEANEDSRLLKNEEANQYRLNEDRNITMTTVEKRLNDLLDL